MTTELGIVKSELENLLQNHSTMTDFSCLDDVVFSYVSGVVEEVSSEDEELDVLEIKDVMGAYIPVFEKIPEQEVELWVKSMVQKTLDLKDKVKRSKDISLDAIVACFNVPARNHKDSSSRTNSESSETAQKVIETSDSPDECSPNVKEESQYSESLSMLMELFPSACSLEAQHCLNVTGGVLDEASILLMERQDQGLSIKTTLGSKIASKTAKQIDDQSLRKNILNRYGFIDDKDDTKEHKPVAPKWEGKKMIRYRDNKVVSLKGERFTEVKKDEADDMKKTYVNLKPGKQYRFH